MLKSKLFGVAARAAFGGVLAMTSAASGQSELFLIDFEEFEEGTEISTQYAGTCGATFSIIGDDSLLPIIAEEGAPTVAFNGSGADNPMSSGMRGLTDPVIGNDQFEENDIAIDFDPPVTSVRLFGIDIDSSDSLTVTAFDGAAEVDSATATSGDAGTGNAKSTEFFLEAESITRLELVISGTSGNIGWGIDFITFTRPCESDGCGPSIEVAQESAPGAGDFDDNVLGEILVFPSVLSPQSFYAYNVPEGDSWNGASLSPEPDRSHLLLAGTTEGLSIVIVHDRAVPNDPDGGDAETRVTVTGDPDGLIRSVADDPGQGDQYVGEDGDSVFTAHHSWDPCCTDGYMLSGLNAADEGEDWVAFIEFTDVNDNPGDPTIGGMTEWVAYSADGAQITLTLEADRRVRLTTIPCAADCNGDTLLNVLDFVCFQGAFAAGEEKGDCNEDGIFNVLDFICYQAEFASGCP